MADQVHMAKLDALAAEIRKLKVTLKEQGSSSAEINRNQAVLDKVSELQKLKEALAGDDPNRDEAFFSRQKAEREEAQKQKQADSEAQQIQMKAQEEALGSRLPLIQRKIFHLFHHVGSGPTFHYEPPARLNAKDCGFGQGDNPHPPVYVTEKWDGTTMQATSTHVFKRMDSWGKRRDGQDPADRYDLRLLAWRDKEHWRGLDFAGADPRVFEALSPHLDKLASLEEGLCVYFEAVHTDINANFKGLPSFADIRVNPAIPL
ncbi:unnamed protein product, partial [Polarella glacialis]